MAEMARQPVEGVPGLWRRLTRRLGRSLYLDLGSGAAATLLVAGSGRSGTTWLAEVVNQDNAYRYLFEPAHPEHGPQAREPAPRPYARPGSRDPALLALGRALAEGKVRDRWTDQYNRKLVARRRLVKDIWVNLLLGWLAEVYPGLRIVLVIRHPCAVADSQFATRWGWRVDPGQFAEQHELVEDHLEPYRGLLTRRPDPFDDYVVTWCVENLVPLRQLAPGRAHVAFYEHLTSEPERELPRLFRYAGRPWGGEVLAEVGRPSSVSRMDGTVTSGRSPIESWQARVSDGRLDRAGELLATFGLDRLYDARVPMPRIRGEEVLASFSTA